MSGKQVFGMNTSLLMRVPPLLLSGCCCCCCCCCCPSVICGAVPSSVFTLTMVGEAAGEEAEVLESLLLFFPLFLTGVAPLTTRAAAAARASEPPTSIGRREPTFSSCCKRFFSRT